MKRIFWIAIYASATLKMRWLGWRIRRRTGLDLNGAHRRGEAARKLAYQRALLIDPTDFEAAKRASEDAEFKAALPRKK